MLAALICRAKHEENDMNKYLVKASALAASLLLAVQAQATSLIDFTDTALTTAATNITDTGTDASAFVLPIIVSIVALVVGVKLFKRFSGKI